MKSFKNKFIWNVFISIMLIPLSVFAGGVGTALILGVIGIGYWMFNYSLLILGIVICHVIIVYKLFTGGFEK